MRAGLSVIPQTLTQESANILNQSIAEASRRTHGQTTPLHVAATLLSSPSGLLRQACVRSYPNTRHPLQSRALELCFSVALERLPAAENNKTEPPISNALMAALKRAQAHQRRGFPEQQQQPLLARKVEVDQLIISILDDPGVSRVMKEAGFHSPAVKSSIEHLVNPQRPLVEWGRIGDLRGEDVNKVFEIMLRNKRRNPNLVGYSEVDSEIKRLLRLIKKEDLKDMTLKNVTIISTEKGVILDRVKELSEAIESRSVKERIILDLGNVKWLMEQQGQGEPVVAEISKLLTTFRRESNEENNVWMIGSAIYEVYMRPFSHPLSMTSFPPPPLSLRSITDTFDQVPFCPECCQNYEKDLAKLTLLPQAQWWQLNPIQDHSQVKTNILEKTQELHKKWKEICLNLHQHNHAPPTLLTHPIMQAGEVVQLKVNSPPPSPLRTDLVLGSGAEKPTEDQTKDLFGGILSQQIKTVDNTLDADSYKKLFKGLMEKAWWQGEAASAVSSAITRARLGNGKRLGRDVWLLFSGPDRVGKKKMTMVIAEQLYGTSPVFVCLGTRRADDTKFRGKTTIDRIAEAVQRDPFSVIMLQDIDEADKTTRGNIMRAAEQGRITDSHGREVGLGKAIFIVTGNWSTPTVDYCQIIEEASENWQFRLILQEKSSKRRGSWYDDEDLQLRQRNKRCPGISLDLNLAASKDDGTYGSHNSSDADHDDHVNRTFFATLIPPGVLNVVNESIVFKPVDIAFIQREIKKVISLKFSMMVDNNVSLEVEDDVIEKVLGELWHDRKCLGEWIKGVLEPSLYQLKPLLLTRGLMVRMVVESDSDAQRKGTGL